jgi:hypothetical protein
MKRLLVVLLVQQAAAAFCAPAPAPLAAPVVVELFTSQGCSSCPPAEKALQKLAEKFGDQIIPLVYHVDYWDSSVWKDTYSDPMATQRQQEYSYALNQDSLYTPEMIVQGEVGFVGARYGAAVEEVQKRQSQQRPRFDLKQPPAGWSGKADLAFSLPQELNEHVDMVTVVVFESFDPVRVLGGENQGVTTSSEFTVTQIHALGARKGGEYQVQIPLPARSFIYPTGVAVLLQGARHNILAAESIFLKGKPHA